MNEITWSFWSIFTIYIFCLLYPNQAEGKIFNVANNGSISRKWSTKEVKATSCLCLNIINILSRAKVTCNLLRTKTGLFSQLLTKNGLLSVCRQDIYLQIHKDLASNHSQKNVLPRQRQNLCLDLLPLIFVQ